MSIISIILVKQNYNKDKNTTKDKLESSENILECPEKNIVGLLNHDYVCYFNSIIQALYYQPNFIDKLFSYSSNEHQTCIILLKDIFAQMSEGKIVDTSKYLKRIIAVTQWRKIFEIGKYQDASRCLYIIFDQIEKEIIHTLPLKHREIVDITKIQSNNFISDFFRLELTCSSYCSYSKETKTYKTNPYFLCLFLDKSVQESINKYFSIHKSVCENHLDESELHYEINRKEIIVYSSNIIIKHSLFPPTTDVLINNKIIIQNFEYIFTACIFHVESVHYYTVVVSETSIYELNDIKVKKINIQSIEDLESKDIPYFLFYRRLN
ncbi:putative ubiquitin carboxyl-terminal hydrolase [Hamiltosporidium magnivora]|uniref:Putative ubiquitin carboxyl-terminal hydrolase n=1 Tax=Hamiltosporidium magnivora TaxID=148818 RepID=A0A4V2JVR7_9MICR|nr:putative ubiquitin carboxyl-terminal hydrolase [Hamiltosporidium magnivora]TBU08372.1 putative ubiquitin carboxyl-terminal hydrolase [Hamiltosporidium magnivora]